MALVPAIVLPHRNHPIARVASASLDSAFEQWWLAGRLHEAGAAACLDRLRARRGDDPANLLRQARRHLAAGEFAMGIELAQAQVSRSGLSAIDRADAAVTLAELLTWRDRLVESRELLKTPLPADSGGTLRFRAFFVRARAAALARDVPSCLAAAVAAREEAQRRFASEPSALAIALLSQGICQRLDGDHGSSLANLERARELGRSLGDARNNQVFAQGLVLLAQGYKISGDMARAERGYDDALAWLRAHPEPFPAQLSALLHGMANLIERLRCAPHRTRAAALHGGRVIMEQVYGADSSRLSQVWNNTVMPRRAGRYDEAIKAFARALQIAESRGDNCVATLMPPISNTQWSGCGRRLCGSETGSTAASRSSRTTGRSETSSLFSRLARLRAVGPERIARRMHKPNAPNVIASLRSPRHWRICRKTRRSNSRTRNGRTRSRH